MIALRGLAEKVFGGSFLRSLSMSVSACSDISEATTGGGKAAPPVICAPAAV